VSCKALIGADGWFSKIRQQLLADEPPVFRDTVVFRARVQRPDWLSSDVTRWWVPEGKVALCLVNIWRGRTCMLTV
jgi:2-polyprenyl-6-methoxyphenol hydroxylase-like FAD-dependent oxidoreductase